jgi:predicted O-methyltransferase YrrM
VTGWEPSGLPGEIADVLALAPLDFGGGCTAFKGSLLGELIVEQRSQVIVEIGVLHGRGALALATAARHVPGAHVWGIDPYALRAYPDAGQDHPVLSQVIADWLAAFDFDAACDAMLERMRCAGLADCFTLVREPSLQAASRFDAGSIDLLHIDGDHSRAAVEADVAAWLPRMAPGGLVVFDDFSWPSIAPSAAALQERAETVFAVIDLRARAGLGANDFIVLRLPAEAGPG